MSRPREKKASQLEVRLARPGDEETVARLLLEAFETFREQYTPGGCADTTATADVVRERFETAKVWLAFGNGKAVGTVTALPVDRGSGVYIRWMAVTPSAEGRGVGQKLLEVLAQDARERGETHLPLSTPFVLPGAQPLY